MSQTLTYSKIHCGIEALQGPTPQKDFICPIGGEEKDVIAQMVTEAVCQETQVVIITGEVGAVLILNLWKRLERRMKNASAALASLGTLVPTPRTHPLSRKGGRGRSSLNWFGELVP